MDNAKLHNHFEAMVQEILKDHKSKGQDYENPDLDVKFTDSYPNAYAVWLQVNKKACRLKSLMGDPAKQRTPKYESLIDNAKDLAAFAIWLAAWLEVEEINARRNAKDS